MTKAKSLQEAEAAGAVIVGEKEQAEMVADEPLVPARFEGAYELNEPPLLLEAGDHRLPLNRTVLVPESVFATLTSGENARLYRVVRDEDAPEDAPEAADVTATGQLPPSDDAGAGDGAS